MYSIKIINFFFNIPFLVIESDTIDLDEILKGPEEENLKSFLKRIIPGIIRSKIKYRGLPKIIIKIYSSKQ